MWKAHQLKSFEKDMNLGHLFTSASRNEDPFSEDFILFSRLNLIQCLQVWWPFGLVPPLLSLVFSLSSCIDIMDMKFCLRCITMIWNVYILLNGQLVNVHNHAVKNFFLW